MNSQETVMSLFLNGFVSRNTTIDFAPRLNRPRTVMSLKLIADAIVTWIMVLCCVFVRHKVATSCLFQMSLIFFSGWDSCQGVRNKAMIPDANSAIRWISVVRQDKWRLWRRTLWKWAEHREEVGRRPKDEEHEGYMGQEDIRNCLAVVVTRIIRKVGISGIDKGLRHC
jgi:hypothetical protein